MANTGKSSEERIRQARRRLAAKGKLQAEPEAGAPAEPQVVPTDPDISRYANYQPGEVSTQEQPEVPADLVVSQPTPQPEPIPQDHPAPPTGNGPRLIASRWFRLAIIVAVGLGYGFFTSLDDADRADTGEIVAAGDLDVMAVQPGDCFDDPPADEDTIFQLDALPCSEPHDNEVFAVQSVAASFGSDYPGRQALEEMGYQMCSGPLFDTYVGKEYLDSSLEVFTFTPTSDSWSDGDREVVCVLYKLDLSKLTHSARNSGL